MKRRDTLKWIGGAAGLGIIGTGTATADPPAEQQRRYDYEGLLDELERIERSSQGSVSLAFAGESLEGREIPVASVGNGETDVFIDTEQHGNEPTGTSAAVEVLRSLGSGGNNVRGVLDALTVHMMLMVNPDGAERNQRVNADGVDPNRNHDYQPGSEDNPSPEAQAMIDAVDEIDPLWVADLHTQTGDYIDDDDNSVTASNYWPIASGVPEDAQDLSKQMNWAMYDEVSQYGYANITQYPGGTNPAIARNAYGLQDRGSVLLEATGQADDRGPRMEGMMIRLMNEEVTTLLEGTVDGSLFDIDPNNAEEIPERPSRQSWRWDTE